MASPDIALLKARMQQRKQTRSSKMSWNNFRRRDAQIGLLFVTPLILYFIVFFIYPVLGAFYYSFTQWDMRSDPIWVGLRNYQQLFFDHTNFPYFWHSLGVTVYYILFAIPLSLLTALTLALLINSLRKGQDIFKIAFYLPVITTEGAVALIWGWIYDPLYGLLNIGLKAIGLPTQNWLNQANLIIPALAIIAAWQCGGAMIIFLAGLKGISTEYYEAASIDGAGGWQKFRFITLPMLKPTTFYLIVTSQIGGFQVFGLVFVLFGARAGNIGGPQQAGLTYVLELFNHAFRYFQMGPACAMSFILFLLIIIVTYLQFRFIPQTYE